MTIRQLEYFMAVARTLNFTDAASEMFVSQPALSRGIASLETELGVSLLERNHHTVALTQAGMLLATELPRLRNDLDRIVSLVRQTENGLMGHLNVGVLEGQQLDEAVQITFRYFAQSLPLVELSPIRMDERELLTGLSQNRLDIIFTLDFGVSKRANLETLQLDTASFCMVVPTDHRLAGKTSAALSDFRTDTFLLCDEPEPSGEAQLLLDCCRQAGFAPNIRRVPDMRARLLWIESGFGVSLFNSASQACRSASARAVPLADVPAVNLILAWRRDTTNPSVRIFTHLAECCL